MSNHNKQQQPSDEQQEEWLHPGTAAHLEERHHLCLAQNIFSDTVIAACVFSPYRTDLMNMWVPWIFGCLYEGECAVFLAGVEPLDGGNHAAVVNLAME